MTLLYVYLFQKNYQLAMNKEVKGFVFNPMLEQVFNINTMSKYVTFWSILRQRCWGLVLVVAGVCVITFIISHLIPVIRRGYWRVTAPAMLSWKIFASNWDWTSHCMYSFTATSATCFMVTWEHPFVPGVRCWKSCVYFSRRRWSWLLRLCRWHS